MTLRELRKRSGLTQLEVANSIDVHQTAVSFWESSKTGICRKHRKRLCVLYDCTADELANAIVETRVRRAEQDVERKS